MNKKSGSEFIDDMSCDRCKKWMLTLYGIKDGKRVTGGPIPDEWGCVDCLMALLYEKKIEEAQDE